MNRSSTQLDSQPLGAFVWHEDKVVPAGTFALSPFDRSFLFGDGVFETLYMQDGKVQLLGRHLARLENTLDDLKLSPGPAFSLALRGLQQVSSKFKTGSYRLRVCVSAGGGYSLKVAELRANEAKVIVLILPFLPSPPKALALTTTPRSDADFRSWKLPFYVESFVVPRKDEKELLFVSKEGDIRECTSSNIFLRLGAKKIWCTPKAEHVLPGTRRDSVIDSLSKGHQAIEVRTIHKSELSKCSAAFATSALSGLQAINQIDGYALPESKAATEELVRLIGPFSMQSPDEYLKDLIL